MKTIPVTKDGAQALDGSVEKWSKIVLVFESNPKNPPFAESGIEDCPLCQLYHPSNNSRRLATGCAECPIKAATGENFCSGTPYSDWVVEEGSIFNGTYVTGETLKNATAMRDYLINLRARVIVQ